MSNFDVVVIGSGPGGYVGAIRCAQLGFKTALIEKYETLGGTCLNVGCIPSKALLDSSEHYFKARKEFEEHGIGVGKLSLDFPKMVSRKTNVVDLTVKGIDFLMKKNNITVLRGVGSFESATKINVTDEEGKITQVETKYVIIATGSKPASLPFIKLDKERVITSTEALSLKEVPKNLLVIGGGIIGLELGSVYTRLGSKVTVIEYADKIGGTMDSEICKELQRVLKKQGMDIQTSMEVNFLERKGKTVTVKALDSQDKEIVYEGDYCLVAVGRKPYTEGLGLEKIGVTLDDRGRIPTDKNLQTTCPNVYAIGDVVIGPMLAHKAEEEGVFVAETLAGQKPHLNHHLIPGIAYTWPEAAGVGKTEDELKKEGTPYKSGKFPFRASGKARAANDLDGFVKVLAHQETDEILGVQMIGARVADMIMQAAIAMTYRGSAEDIAITCFGHPTFSEAFKEAALDASAKRAIHI
ncbi:MAG: dihydrolipoyl dehydrogenase [Chitinophagales bacterium]|jgi:dihydrolipoamide dehydrogenase|nr:dihydrolipoyl dehydrogenase [Sphingobacteriales bacterium]